MVFVESSASRARRKRALQDWSSAPSELISEIATTAQQIAGARNSDLGAPARRTDATWWLLETLERSHYCLAIADVARALGIRRQSAHEIVHAAVRLGVVELQPNPDDRRLLQCFLTSAGRRQLAAWRSVESAWCNVLLNGLGDREMALCARVLRAIRQRLAARGAQR